MICEKCGKNNPAKNTVCSSCNEPLPASNNCGGFADILTVNVNVPEASASSTSVISSVSSARTEAAVNKLSLATEALTKKNGFLMILGFGAAGLALIAIIVAITATLISGGINNSYEMRFNEIDKSITELEGNGDSSLNKYDSVTDAMVYEFLEGKITIDFSTNWTYLVNGMSDSYGTVITQPYNFSNENENDAEVYTSYILTLDSIESYLNNSEDSLSDTTLALIKNHVFSAVSNAFDADSDSSAAYEWLFSNYPTIGQFFKSSDNYKNKEKELTDAHNNALTSGNLLKPDSFEGITQEEYTVLFNNYISGLIAYNTTADELKNKYNIALNEEDYEKLPTDVEATALYQDNIYTYFTDYEINFHVSGVITYVMKNDDKFSVKQDVKTQETENPDSENTNPEAPNKTPDEVKSYEIPEVPQIDGFTFMGWSGVGKDNFKFEFNSDFYVNGTVNEIFEKFDRSQATEDNAPDKVIDLYPVYHSEELYTVSFKVKEADTERDLYSIENRDPYTISEDDIKGIENSIPEIKGKKFVNWENEKGSTKTNEDLKDAKIKSLAGTWYAVYEDENEDTPVLETAIGKLIS